MQKKHVVNGLSALLGFVLSVLLVDWLGKPVNRPVQFDVLEAIEGYAFVYSYFGMPQLLAMVIATVSLLIPAVVFYYVSKWITGMWLSGK